MMMMMKFITDLVAKMAEWLNNTQTTLTFLNPRYMICSSLRVNLVVRQSASRPSGLQRATCFSVSSTSWSETHQTRHTEQQ